MKPTVSLESLVRGWDLNVIEPSFNAVKRGYDFESARLRGSRFVLVLLTREYDYDGLTETVELNGGFAEPEEARHAQRSLCERRSHEQLMRVGSPGHAWSIVRFIEEGVWPNGRGELPLAAFSSKISDGSGFNSTEIWTTLVGVQPLNPLDEVLIRAVGRNWELARWFMDVAKARD
jgi:hypothetical protein